MLCKDCGHEYPSVLPRCRKCGRLTPKRSESRLLQFPRQPQTRRDIEESARSLPAWRSELSDRVRAIRARKSNESASGAKAVQVERPDVPASQSDPDPQMSLAAEPRLPAEANAAIIEAAIQRVRRASETARAAMLQKSSATPADRRATARALAPQPDPQSYEQSDLGRIELNFEFDDPVAHEAVAHTEPLPGPAEEVLPRYQEQVQPDLYSGLSDWPEPEPAEKPDEGRCDYVADVVDPVVAVSAAPAEVAVKSDPLDYLTAEVRKVDEALGREFSRNQPASLVSRIITDAIDAFIIAASFSLFAGSLAAFGANFRDVPTAGSLAGVLVLISFFYLVTTHCLCGKTFGMMFTNTRLVDAGKLTAPNSRQLFRRVLGYYVAAIPFAMGFLWILVDKKRRGWQDHLADTLLATDY